MQSIVSYPDRGNQYGKNTYRGNCSGLLIKDLIAQYKLQGLSDFMVGSGTTEDVVKEAGIRGDFADLNRGYDMMSMDIPKRAENIFWHPPYHDMIVYSGKQYDAKAVQQMTGLPVETILADDLSRCASWEEFVKKMNYCMLKQFSALEKGGRMFVLVGDMKRKGKLYSMIRDLICPGTMENIIIKAQHNCWSDRQSYSGSFVPIVHEYLLVTRKDAGLIVPVSWGTNREYDMRSFRDMSWRDLVYTTIEENGGQMNLQELYDALKDSAKAKANQHWQEKVRQTVQNVRRFVRTERGTYALAPAA
jgi:hypothetical protein